MKAISSRTQWWLIGAAYGVVVLFGGSIAVPRYLYEMRHPAEVDASSGMWAFGDMMMWTFIFAMLMLPTFFALRLMAKSEDLYTKYAKAVLTFAVTAPLCGGLLTILKKESLVTDTCLWRLIWSPCIMVAIAASRVVARFRTAKKLLSYAVLTEGLTLAVTVALFLSEGYRPH